MRAKLHTTAQRSALMKSVGRANTAPEMAVRRYLHGLGFQYRVNVRGVPGTPDIVLPRFRTVVFVHGCFWHGHDCRHGAVAARSNASYWQEKIAANRERDARKARELRDLGWFVETLFECQVADTGILKSFVTRVRRRFDPRYSPGAATGAVRRRSIALR